MRRTALVLMALACLAAAPAQAETVTIGPNVNQPPTTTPGTGLATVAQTTGTPAAAPFDGKIDRWRINIDTAISGGSCTVSCKLSLQILRPDGMGGYRAVYDGQPRDITTTGVSTFEEVAPVQAGDIAGIKELGISSTDQPASYTNGVAVDTASRFLPPLTSGGAFVMPSFNDNLKVLLLNADFTRTVSASTPESSPAAEQTPAPPQPGTFPQPAPAQSAAALPASGTVLVRRPGTNAFVELREGQVIPNGSVVDARRGVVLIITATDFAGGIQYALVYGGVFRVEQTAKSFPVTEITLVEKVPFRTACPTSGSRARASGKGPERHVWGKGKGKFRTHGNNSSAIVRGTEWLTQDTCSGTLTRVKEGIVGVRDEVKRRTVLVRAGQSYLARNRRR